MKAMILPEPVPVSVSVSVPESSTRYDGRSASITSALTHQISELPHPGWVDSSRRSVIDVDVKGTNVSPYARDDMKKRYLPSGDNEADHSRPSGWLTAGPMLIGSDQVSSSDRKTT